MANELVAPLHGIFNLAVEDMHTVSVCLNVKALKPREQNDVCAASDLQGKIQLEEILPQVACTGTSAAT